MEDEMKRFKRFNTRVYLGFILLATWLTVYVSVIFVMLIPFIVMTMLVVNTTIASILSEKELD